MSSTISTHVLDATVGSPAAGISVVLQRRDGTEVSRGTTDLDGRIGELVPDGVPPGDYRIVFDTGGYFAAAGQETFYPEVAVSFATADGQHYHVPLLLSPHAYTTYRGS